MDGFRVFLVLVAGLIFSGKAFATPALTDLIRELDDKQASLRDLIQGRFDFVEGEEGSSIGDGGNDMYDGGNVLNTNLQMAIPYTNGQVTQTTVFGTNSSYFTKKYAGFFVMGADKITIDSFAVTGDTGADGGGEQQFGQLVLDGYSVFFKRTFGAGDPSINHLIFVPQILPAGNHTIVANDTNNDFDSVVGLNGTKDIYYLLFATENGGRVDDAVMSNVARRFISFLKPSGAQHNCLARGGRLKCWGYNGYGQLGLGDVANRGDAPNQMGAQLPFLDLGTDFEVVQSSSGGAHTCAVSRNRNLKCWGLNETGQLGRGDVLNKGGRPNEMGNQLIPVSLGATNNIPVLQVATGSRHNCALIEDGRVKCWGNNASGQLGLGDMRARGMLQREMGAALPYVDIGQNMRATQLVAGRDHSCALLTNNTVKCWGGNSSGQLGIGTALNVGDAPNEMGPNLVAVPLGNTRILKLVAGLDFNCVLFEGGSIQCWGDNRSGQLALGDMNPRGMQRGEVTPATVAKLGEGQIFNDLACGGFHCCARSLQNTLKCWGANESGQLGLGDIDNRGISPADVGDELQFVDTGVLSRVGSCSLGQSHTCAEVDGGWRCWGQNGRGQLGSGTSLAIGSTPTTTPDQLSNIEIF